MQKTPLYAQHLACGGKIVDFGGWAMPVNYGSQMEEHHAVRKTAGMFDVSHMTIVDVSGNDALAFLQQLLANDVALLSLDQALYSAMLNPAGGVIDDLIVYKKEWGYRLVVNCATRQKDLDWLNHHGQHFDVNIHERDELAMIALQGPQAESIAKAFFQSVGAELPLLSDFYSGDVDFMMSDKLCSCFIAKTGYTGERGFEIVVPAGHAEALWVALLALEVKPCGLGARDTLRLEAGMNLYGHEMDEETSPLVANMAWTIRFENERDFIGRQALLDEKAQGLTHRLVGIVLKAGGILREGQPIVLSDSDAEGVVTSGTFSPTLGVSIGLARVPVEVSGACFVERRGKRLPVDIVKPRFVKHGSSLI